MCDCAFDLFSNGVAVLFGSRFRDNREWGVRLPDRFYAACDGGYDGNLQVDYSSETL